MRQPGFSPLPVRPLRLSPITATAGGRATCPPGTARHQLAAVTPKGARPRAGAAPSSRRSSLEPDNITVKGASACGLRVAC
jgi:hypothetical protein